MRPDLHRYMIVLAAAQGYTVTEVPVPLYPRHAGRSKFGLSRIPVGVLDMLAVWFELRFGQKPLLAFGMMGAALFAHWRACRPWRARLAAVTGQGQRWVWTLIQTCLMLGSIFFASGLLGELIAQQRAELRELRRELDDVLARSRGRASARRSLTRHGRRVTIACASSSSPTTFRASPATPPAPSCCDSPSRSQDAGARRHVLAPAAAGLSARDDDRGRAHAASALCARRRDMTLAYEGTMAEAVRGSWRRGSR